MCFFFKNPKIPYCIKCGKLIEDEKKSANGLCFECYCEYLLQKIDRHQSQHRKPIIYKEKFSKRIHKFIKNLLKRKQK